MLTSTTVTIDDAMLHVDTAGDGEPVLFIHGFPLTGAMWHPTVERIADRWRCIVPDLRGHGRSSSSETVSIARFAEDLAALLDRLREWRPVVLVGLSLGGIIAFEFYRRYRDRVRALVLCNTRANPESPEGVERRETLAGAVRKTGSRAAADAMIEQLFAPAASAGLRATWHRIMCEQSPVGVAATAMALAGRPDSYPTLPRIDCPTLVVAGEEDAITPPATLDEIHRGVRGSRLVVIPQAGHMPPVERPDAFASVLRRFLEGLG
ncbi:MAG: alpha/beta fold hydrolase [Phycisphaerae bacterium]|nr:alpha/beta fold hydrolase [Phycisphaerae bacterium]